MRQNVRSANCVAGLIGLRFTVRSQGKVITLMSGRMRHYARYGSCSSAVVVF